MDAKEVIELETRILNQVRRIINTSHSSSNNGINNGNQSLNTSVIEGEIKENGSKINNLINLMDNFITEKHLEKIVNSLQDLENRMLVLETVSSQNNNTDIKESIQQNSKDISLLKLNSNIQKDENFLPYNDTEIKKNITTNTSNIKALAQAAASKLDHQSMVEVMDKISCTVDALTIKVKTLESNNIKENNVPNQSDILKSILSSNQNQ